MRLLDVNEVAVEDRKLLVLTLSHPLPDSYNTRPDCDTPSHNIGFSFA